MITSLITRPCSIITRTDTARDVYGDETKIETIVTSLCELQPLNQDELDDQSLAVSRYKLFLAGSADLHSDDAVMVGADRYELIGDSAPRRNPVTGVVVYTEALVRRVR